MRAVGVIDELVVELLGPRKGIRGVFDAVQNLGVVFAARQEHRVSGFVAGAAVRIGHEGHDVGRVLPAVGLRDELLPGLRREFVEYLADEVEIVHRSRRPHHRLGRFQHGLALVHDGVDLHDAVREAHERLDEAVDLRGELEAELLQLRDSSLQAVDDVEREPALGLAQHGIEYGLRLLAVRREGGLAFCGEELLESGQHEVLVAECRAHDHAHQLLALVHAVRAVGLELVEVAEVDEGDVVPADHEVAGVRVAMELAGAEDRLVEPHLRRLEDVARCAPEVIVGGGEPRLEVEDGGTGDVRTENGHLLRLARLRVDHLVLPLDAVGGLVALEHRGGRIAHLADFLLEVGIDRLADGDLRDEDVLLRRHHVGELHAGDVGGDGLQAVVRAPLDVVQLDARVDVLGLGAEVELGHVLLELALPRLVHARDLLRGLGEYLGLALDADLRVVAHELDDERLLLLHFLHDGLALAVEHGAALVQKAVVRIFVDLRLLLRDKELELAEERLADGRRAEGLLQLDGLDLAVRAVDDVHQVRLHDLARYRREVCLHVGERVGEVAHDLLRKALHHLLEKRARALQDGAGELVERRLVGALQRLPLLVPELEGVGVAHGGGEAGALVGLRELREVRGDHLAEEADLPRRVRRRGGVEDLVEALLV